MSYQMTGEQHLSDQEDDNSIGERNRLEKDEHYDGVKLSDHDTATSRLCRSCTTRVKPLVGRSHESQTDQEITFELDSKVFQAAAEAGCLLCGSLWDEIPEESRVMLLGPRSWTLEMWMEITCHSDRTTSPTPEILGLLYSIWVSSMGVNQENDPLSIYLNESNHYRLFPVSDTIPKQIFDDSTSSLRSMTIAKSWIKTCIESHPLCLNQHNAIHWLPTRLLYIGDSPAKIRVIHTAEHILQPNEKYVTLSHCWGQVQPLRLRKHNNLALQHGIPLERLPQTFQHAIIITRRLQINYIWIDSLCIIQDEPGDWLHESSLMHKVYANGVCNLAATAARDSSEGLFFNRDVQKLQKCLVEIPSGNARTLYEICVDKEWERIVSNAPLNRRGWVIQERLLARRVLHFGNKQLAWECCEIEATERYPKGLPAKRAWEPRFKLLDPKINSPSSVKQEQEPVALWPYQKWQEIVRVYSRAGLTKSSDKLVALSGLASHFKTVCNDEYVAGMWKPHLCSQLLWRAQRDVGVVRSQQYLAPSFSWAALDGQISPGSITESGIVAKILDISIQRSGGDETGAVRGGHLVLSGRMMRIQTKSAFSKKVWQTTFVNDQELQPLSQAAQSDGHLWANIDVETETFPQPSYILQVQHQTRADGPAFIDCLVLTHKHGTRGDYVRMGTLYANQSWNLEVLQQPGGEDKIPCERYDPETGHHVIRLF